MKESPDDQYRYPARTADGVKYLNEEEKNLLLESVFAPLPGSPDPKQSNLAPMDEHDWRYFGVECWMREGPLEFEVRAIDGEDQLRIDEGWKLITLMARPEDYEERKDLERRVAAYSKELSRVRDAVINLIQVKGRYNTQQAYERLKKVIDEPCPHCEK